MIGITQRDLAQRCGVTFQQVQKYEVGGGLNYHRAAVSTGHHIKYTYVVSVYRTAQSDPRRR